MLGLRQAEEETKKCGRCCKFLLLCMFKFNSKSGSLYSKCETCRPKHSASANSSVNRAAVQTAFKKTDKGKAVVKRAKTSEKGKAKEKRFRTSEKGKAIEKRFKTSEKGKAAEKRAKTSEKGKAREKRYREGNAGKAANKRYREGDAGQAKAERFSAKRQKRRQESPAMRLAAAIKCAANQLVAGRIETSPTFLERTSFESEVQFLEHMKAECSKNDLVFEERSKWTIDRKIPEEAYDFDNLDDVLRCWSPSNITAMTRSENMEKSWKLIDSWIASAGSACYPLSWKGCPPTEEIKKDHQERMLAPKPVGEQLEGPVSNESDSEESDFEESDSNESESEEDEFEACGDQGAGSSSDSE
jgi:hypothetical protein